MSDLIRRISWSPNESASEPLLTREWLVTNGLGGYASGTISGVTTRRYHGLLIAALPAPLGRMVMLNCLSETIRLPDARTIRLHSEEKVGGLLELEGASYLREFRLEDGLPVWRYDVQGFVVERSIVMPHGQNTVHISYRVVAGDGVLRLKIRPSVDFRPHEAPVDRPLSEPYSLTTVAERYELSCSGQCPPLRFFMHGERHAFTVEGKHIQQVLYRVEESRGYHASGDLWSPGYFRADVSRDHMATLVASTEPWETILALDPDEARAAAVRRQRRLVEAAVPHARNGVPAELVLAADQFIIRPVGRVEDAARAHAAGDEVRTVIAGYHWFTDWGRDTMISLEGLTLVTGRQVEAGYILRTFAQYVRDGLIPNLFPEGNNEGLYHTADATLWFFHAVARYLDATGDRLTLRHLLDTLVGIIDQHVRGTRFGIHVDANDGLLCQGASGYQLTWMDAKVDDWVVTPRRGKAVEINALWYNALRLVEQWVREERGDAAARPFSQCADRAGESFNRRFWYADGGYLYDVVDGEHGDDASCRPNQVFAISLPHPVLDQSRWPSVMRVVRDRLLTPVGLRSLAPGSADYKARYYGDLRARDAAYHQGTVWAWLAGPYVDAWMKVFPSDMDSVWSALSGFEPHLFEACVGSISEIFDAEPPFAPRGCVAQAWSVAEVLRAWVKATARQSPSAREDLSPSMELVNRAVTASPDAEVPSHPSGSARPGTGLAP